MTGLIINPYNESKITVQTRKGWDIPNIQSHEFSQQEQNQFSAMERHYSLVTWRAMPNPIYNCHGLTFASRRTSIFDSSVLQQILDHDGYEQINDADVLPGDIILYFGSNGDIEHSGIVVTIPQSDLKIPRVVSKWGKFKEAEHSAIDCPYSFQNHRYYRVTRWD